MSNTAADSSGMSIPLPNPESVAPFWHAAVEERLQFPRCLKCGQFNWYPVPVCAACGSEAQVWTEVQAAPRVFSWAYARRALDSRLAPLVHYATVLVEFDDAPGVQHRDVVAQVADGLSGIAGVVVGYPAVRTGIVAPLLAVP